jgi:hypothetical protein
VARERPGRCLTWSRPGTGRPPRTGGQQ